MKKILIILLCFTLCGCGYNEYDMPDDVILTKNENKFKVFKDIRIKDLIKESNVDIINPEEKITTNFIGDHHATIEYNYKGRKYKHEMVYNIYDNEEPLIINYSSNITILVDNEVDPCSKINYIDNYDREPTCTIKGDYDTTKVGNYKLQYSIKDSSNNEAQRDLTLNVLNEYPPSKNTNPNETPEKKYDLIEDMIANFKTDDMEIGIDISRWQGDIDFNQVKDAGVSFVIMRIGIQSKPEAELTMDTKFEEYIKKAKEVGLKIGVYVYSSAINKKMAKEHAKWVIKALGGTKLDFPIAFDWENWSHIKEYNVSINDMRNIYKAFYYEIRLFGYESMLYSSKNYLETIWGVDYDKVWLAHYTKHTSYGGSFQLWQFTNVGKVPGIDADVDLDFYYKNK